MENIDVIITTRNKVNIPVKENGKLMSFCADGSAVVLLTSGIYKNHFKRVQLNEIRAVEKAETVD